MSDGERSSSHSRGSGGPEHIYKFLGRCQLTGRDWKCKKGEVAGGARAQRYQEWGENRVTKRGGEIGLRTRWGPYLHQGRGDNGDAQQRASVSPYSIPWEDQGTSFVSTQCMEESGDGLEAASLGLSTRDHSK